MTEAMRRAERKRHSRDRIVEAASRLIRSRGARGTRVAEAMRAAGLTHGAFYSHFPDKDALLVEALTVATEHREGWLRDADEADARRWIGRVAARYLNTRHRDRPEEGCPYPAIIAELGGTGGAAGETLRRELEHTVQRMAQGLEARGVPNATHRALALTALMVGAMQMARALDEPKSTATLAAARQLAEAAARSDHPEETR